jgi:hypothetical protein
MTRKDEMGRWWQDGGKANDLMDDRGIDVASPTLAAGGTPGPRGRRGLTERIIAALRTVHDPEIPVNIYDLGLIYRIEPKQGLVEIDMTLTAGCPSPAKCEMG